MPSFSEYLIQSLHSLGVKYIFGIPGGPSLPYMEAMRKGGIDFVLVANEQSAAIMADVVGRLTGTPGICHATFGPGATNLATGIGGALLDRSPVIAFTTEVKDADRSRKVQMNIDHQALYRPLTKWTTRLSKENFETAIRDAFRVAVSGVPGPVHIGLPADIHNEVISPCDLAKPITKAPLAAPSALGLTQATELLKHAEKPLIAVGLNAVRLGLHSLIRQFVEKNNMPVVLTPMAKGVLGDAHPCYAGVLFHANSEIVADTYRQADLIIGIGYDPIEFNYEAWMPKVPLLHIDTEQADITPEFHDVFDVTGNPADTLTFMNTLLLPKYKWNLEQLVKNKAKLFEALMPKGNTFTPSDVILALQEAMPVDGIITADVGAHLHLLGQLWRVDEPHRFLITNGWSAMGFGIPAALGAKLCKPKCTVVCLTGDGGFLMNCGELLTARRLGLHVIIVVLCDKELSLIAVKQQRQQIARYGTDLYQGDFFEADTFLGVPILKASDPDSIRTSLQTALSMSGPVIIEAIVESSTYGNLITRTYQ